MTKCKNIRQKAQAALIDSVREQNIKVSKYKL